MPIQVYPLLHSIPKKDGRKQCLQCGPDTVHCLCGIYGYMKHHSAKLCADQLFHYRYLASTSDLSHLCPDLAVFSGLCGTLRPVYVGILKQISLPPGSLLSYIIRERSKSLLLILGLSSLLNLIGALELLCSAPPEGGGLWGINIGHSQPRDPRGREYFSPVLQPIHTLLTYKHPSWYFVL